MKARGQISSRDRLSPSRPALPRLAQPMSALSRPLTASWQPAAPLRWLLCGRSSFPSPQNLPGLLLGPAEALGASASGRACFQLLPIPRAAVRTGWSQPYCHCCPRLGTLCAGLPRPGRRAPRSQRQREGASRALFGKGKPAKTGDTYKGLGQPRRSGGRRQ